MKTNRILRALVAVSGLVLLGCGIVYAPGDALAGQPRLVTKFGNWDTYIVFEGTGNDKACYMASRSKVEDIGDKKRGGVYAVITHRPADNTLDVFSYIAGYTYKVGAEVSVDVDGQKFALFTEGDTAWTPGADTDSKLAKAIRGGKVMTVTGTSARGTKTVDTLDLSGSSAAYEAITKECR